MTTRESKIIEITKAIQAAVPELMEKEEGCYVNIPNWKKFRWSKILDHKGGGNYTIYSRVDTSTNDDEYLKDYGYNIIDELHESNFQVLGSPIGCREILLWLDTITRQSYFIRSNGDICEEYFDSYIEVTQYLFHTTYNLHKDTLDQQSDELIDFLFTFTQS